MRPALQAILFGPPGWVRALSPGSIPSLALDFANQRYWTGQNLGAVDAVPGWSFSRTGTEYEANSAGSLVSFASGVPAITDLGLQVWEARTNLVLQSNTLNNASWTNNANISFGTPGTFIDGTSTFALLTATSTNACRAEVGPITVASGATYTLSAYFKAGSANGFIRWKTATTQAQFKLNLSSGATTAGPSNSGNAATVTLTQVSTGIWRATLTVAADATSVAVAVGIWDGTADQFGYPGTTSGTTVYAGGVQLEAASFAGPYIPTTTASATRGAASASVGGLSLQKTAFTVLAVADLDANDGVDRAIVSLGVDANNFVDLGRDSLNRAVAFVSVGGVSQYQGLVSGYTGARTMKAAVTYDGSIYTAAFDGTAVAASAAGKSSPTLSTVLVGLLLGGTQILDGRVKRFVFYPYSMTAAQLASLTS